MADTATTATPTKAGAEAFRKNGLPKDATPPKASEIDLATFDITDPELWRQEAYWGYFARMRNEAPVSYTPDSPFGPYWNVTTYKDIMTVDTSHGVFSSEGGIIVVDQDEDFQLPMFIAMDPPKHDLQRKTVANTNNELASEMILRLYPSAHPFRNTATDAERPIIYMSHTS